MAPKYISGKGHFVDTEFSHNDKDTIGDSIFGSGVTWKRPKYICDNPQLYVNGPSRFDISQGIFFALLQGGEISEST